MDKTWLEQKTKECESVRPEIERLLKKEFKISEKDFDNIMDDLDSRYHNTADSLLRLAIIMKCGENGDYDKEYKYYMDLIDSSGIEDLFNKYTRKNVLHRYLDSDPMEFDGDIIITDPCYIMREENELTKDDWAACNYGSEMEALGIIHYMTRDTLYGDWSCTTFNTDTKEVIGDFCADAGLVSVFLLDEVLKYNPEFDYHLNKKWTTTWIKDFKGTVEFIVKLTEGYYEEDTSYYKKGDYWEDYSVEVVGHGINKVTGEPINFVGKQTGF